MDNALELVQFGGKKPWEGEDVFDVVYDHGGDTFRAIYTVRFTAVVHVFKFPGKKSPKGFETAQTGVDLVSTRLKLAQKDGEAHYGKSK